MRRITVNFIVDAISFIDLVGLAISGFAIRYIPHGGRGQGFRGGREPGQIRELWGMSRHEWGDVHFYLAVLFVILMVVHIILHWNWIKCYLKSLFLRKAESKCVEDL